MTLRHGFVKLRLRNELLFDYHAVGTLAVRLTLPILVRDFHLAEEANNAIAIVALLWLHGNLSTNHTGGLVNKLFLEFILRVFIITR